MIKDKGFFFIFRKTLPSKPGKISVAITPVPLSDPTSTPVPPNLPALTPITNIPTSIKTETMGPPPVESLLATLSHQLQATNSNGQGKSNGNGGNGGIGGNSNNMVIDAAQAAADLATKEWLSSSKVFKKLNLTHVKRRKGNKTQKRK